MKQELKKISWPTFGTAVKLSLIAITLSVIVGALSYAVDTGVISIFRAFF